MKTWYAVYTKKNCEKNVIYHLIKKDINYYYPLNRVKKHDKYVSKPLFPSYVFVFISETELQIVQKIKDVVNPLYWKNQPAKFLEEEMERIISFLNNHITIQVQKVNVQMKLVQNEVCETENSNLDILAISKLGVLLKSERIPAPSFNLIKEQPLSKFLFRFGWSNLL